MSSSLDDLDDLPHDAWAYWPVELPAGAAAEVVGAGPCHDRFALARTVPDGPWHRAPTPPEAISAACGVSVELARAAFLG